MDWLRALLSMLASQKPMPCTWRVLHAWPRGPIALVMPNPPAISSSLEDCKKQCIQNILSPSTHPLSAWLLRHRKTSLRDPRMLNVFFLSHQSCSHSLEKPFPSVLAVSVEVVRTSWNPNKPQRTGLNGPRPLVRSWPVSRLAPRTRSQVWSPEDDISIWITQEC